MGTCGQPVSKKYYKTHNKIQIIVQSKMTRKQPHQLTRLL